MTRIWRRIVALAQSHPLAFGTSAFATIVVLAAGLFVGSTLLSAASLERDVSEILSSFQGPKVRELTTAEGYADLIHRLSDINDRMGPLRQRVGLMQAGQWIPWLGTKVEDSLVVLEMADRFANAVLLVLQGYAPAVYALDAGPAPVDVNILRQRLETARPLWEEARQELDIVRELRSQLKNPEGLGDRVSSSLEQMDQYVPLLELAVVVARDTPQLVGEVLDIRDNVRTLRSITAADPGVFLQRPEELGEVFKQMHGRALQAQGDLQKVKSAVQGSNAQVIEAVDAALQVSVLLADLSDGLGRFATAAEATFTNGPFSPEAASILGQQLPEISQLLQAVQQELAEVNTLVASQTSAVGGGSLLVLLAMAVGSPAHPLQREEALLSTAVKVVDFLTFFLGYDDSGPKKYLLIGQNDDEIRATGGFIGVVVEMTLEQGELVGLRYMDSAMVDAPPYDTNPLPPEPIYRYLWMARLLFRDGNWNPHFPASATQLADLYERGQGVRVDGVIAATEEVVLDLVNALGGIRVPEGAAAPEPPHGGTLRGGRAAIPVPTETPVR